MVPSRSAVSGFLSLRCITTAASPRFRRSRPPPHTPICAGRPTTARCLLVVADGRGPSPILAGARVHGEERARCAPAALRLRPRLNPQRSQQQLSNQASTRSEGDGGPPEGEDGEANGRSGRCAPYLASPRGLLPAEEGEMPARRRAAATSPLPPLSPPSSPLCAGQHRLSLDPVAVGLHGARRSRSDDDDRPPPSPLLERPWGQSSPAAGRGLLPPGAS